MFLTSERYIIKKKHYLTVFRFIYYHVLSQMFTHGNHAFITDVVKITLSFSTEIFIIDHTSDRSWGSDWILAILLYMALWLFVWVGVCFLCEYVWIVTENRADKMTSSRGPCEQKRSLLPIRKSSHPARHGWDFIDLRKLPKACKQTFSKKQFQNIRTS